MRMAGEFMSTESLRTCLGRRSQRSLVGLPGQRRFLDPTKEYAGIGSRISRASSFLKNRRIETVSGAG